MKFRYVAVIAEASGTIGAHYWDMSTLRIGLGAALMLMGCTPIDPAQNTFPQQPEPTQVAGPPGGQMDPQYQPNYGGYQQQAPDPAQQAQAQSPDQPGYPAGYASGGEQPGYPASTEDQAAAGTSGYGTGDITPAPSLGGAEASDDPNAQNYAMGQVTDDEIDQTLDGYGQWEDNDEYGRIWRPDTTAVGVDFTPYETAGSWLWSDAGWNYQCDWDWGWLPFHYGRWGWFDGYWGWQPGNTWTAGAVEWRGGGGYTGWRPLAPIVRDHRGHSGQGPIVRDHRASVGDSQWRFAANNEFGHGHIRGHLFQNPAEGLRVTAQVKAPAIRGNYSPVASSSIMRNRFARATYRGNGSTVRNGYSNGGTIQRGSSQSFRNQAPSRANQTPTWRPQQPAYQTGRPTQSGGGYRQPTTTYGNRPYPSTYRPAYRPPQQSNTRPSYTGPARSYGGGNNSGSFHSSGGSTYHPSPAPAHYSGGSSSGSSYHSSGGSSHVSGGSSSHSSGGGGGGGGRHR